MKPRHHEHFGSPSGDRETGSRETRGFTLLELILALFITSLAVVSLSGLMLAVQSAWTVSKNYQEVGLQGRGILDRVRWMVAQTGTYRIGSGKVQLGLSVISRSVDGVLLPETLVVWSGGRSGGIQQKRQPAVSLPKINELVIFTPDPASPNHLVEILIASNSSTIDFADVNFAATIQSLISGSAAGDRLTLTDRLRTCRVSESGSLLGNLRFELLQLPSNEQVTTTTAGSDQWYALPWSQGMGFSRGGLRTAFVRLEIQLETVQGSVSVGQSSPTSLPILGSASVRYAYRA
jgi:prepilin-type N-terminal cleavage/methylation domain-containing protein